MFKKVNVDKVKTYFFGVAIGCTLVTLILIAKANLMSRQLAEAEAAARSANAQAAPTASPASR